MKEELLKQYNRYPYAVDACLYFYFGLRCWDNIMTNAIKGSYGKNSQIVDYSYLSGFMMDYEYCYLEHLDSINDTVKNLETFGGRLSDFY